jgi:hypothetical protein
MVTHTPLKHTPPKQKHRLVFKTLWRHARAFDWRLCNGAKCSNPFKALQVHSHAATMPPTLPCSIARMACDHVNSLSHEQPVMLSTRVSQRVLMAPC